MKLGTRHRTTAEEQIARDMAEMRRERYRLETLARIREWERKEERHARAMRPARKSAPRRFVSFVGGLYVGGFLFAVFLLFAMRP